MSLCRPFLQGGYRRVVGLQAVKEGATCSDVGQVCIAHGSQDYGP